MIRTRFAPSPTGELHVGGARTALFAYLFAKSKGGDFLLRIEDTDRERLVEGSIERIIDSLRWLNIIPDNIENPMIQSDRKEVYKKHAFDLVRAGNAYICTCSKEKLLSDREKQKKEKKPPRYEGHCRNADFSVKDLTEGCFVIRMKMPESGKIIINDLIRGKVSFEASVLDDQIILKSDGFPTYHLASVIDDHEMGISHVIRAEEWLPSTPKHLELFKMFGWEEPKYAHLPMILGSNKKKLSKRHGATSIDDYKKLGYIPEAVTNFMAFLGWNPKDDSLQYFSMKELISEFKIENVNKSSAIFDIEKLNSINEHYLKSVELDSENLKNFGLEGVNHGEKELIQRGGFKTLNEALDYVEKLRKSPDYKGELLIFKKSDKEKAKEGVKDAIKKINNVTENEFKAEKLQEILNSIVKEAGLSNGDVFWPVRVALSGEEKSPSPVELMVALGKDESLKRLELALGKLA